MSETDYIKAQKLARKEYQKQLFEGKQPTLPVLDEILAKDPGRKEVSLGTIAIPLRKVVGTKNGSRSNSFAANFMPLLDPDTEFARKWVNLSIAQETEGIRDPIIAYEYLNRYYVAEGNKRVSVLKYYQAPMVEAAVTRIIPHPSRHNKEVILYYAYMDFYHDTLITELWFSAPESFAALIRAAGKEPGTVWAKEDRLDLISLYRRFRTIYKKHGGDHLPITTGDAFLAFLELYDYREAGSLSTGELDRLITSNFSAFRAISTEDPVSLQLDPPVKKANLLTRILPKGTPHQKIAFFYPKNTEISAWTYSHEMGRRYLEEKFVNEVSTFYYDEQTPDTIESSLNDAIGRGAKILFAASPEFAAACARVARAHPQLHILNCSLRMPYTQVYSYYPRTLEVKFLIGMIAGALSQNDTLVYLSDHKFTGTISCINAFALGAAAVNPRVKVHLLWMEEYSLAQLRTQIAAIAPDLISGYDLPLPSRPYRTTGLYQEQHGHLTQYAMPIIHWGHFYRQIVTNILEGSIRYDKNTVDHAMNFWWGLPSGVLDLHIAGSVPAGLKRLVEAMYDQIKRRGFYPFSGVIYSQDGIVQKSPAGAISPEEVARMNWLAGNVIGHPDPVKPEHPEPFQMQSGE